MKIRGCWTGIIISTFNGISLYLPVSHHNLDESTINRDISFSIFSFSNWCYAIDFLI